MIVRRKIHSSVIHFVLLFPVLFVSMNCNSQGFSNLFMFGYDCCSPGFGGSDINWYSGTPVLTNVSRSMNYLFTNANITTAEGDLLFYTNGVYIANRLNNQMLNGDGLAPGYITSVYHNLGLPIQQGAIILPANQGASSLYYLFHETGDSSNCSFGCLPSRLLCTTVDMSLDSGLGAVVSKNVELFTDTLTWGMLTACRHANGRDWWVVIPKTRSNLYHLLLVTPFEIVHTIQNIGLPTHGYDLGQTVFSPDGTHYARMDPRNGLQVMEFDRCTGTFYNYQHLDSANFTDMGQTTGASFSASSRYLYVSNTMNIFQLDMLAPNLLQSMMTVATYDGFVSPGPIPFFISQLYNDGKIYFATVNGSNWLHVINYPDSAGLTCDVQQHSIQLPTQNAGTLHTPPNFILRAMGSSICDSLITSTGSINYPEKELRLFPNPAHSRVLLALTGIDPLNVSILDLMNRSILISAIKENGNEFILEIKDLKSGVYIVRVSDRSGKIYSRKLVVE